MGGGKSSSGLARVSRLNGGLIDTSEVIHRCYVGSLQCMGYRESSTA